ncbi:ECF-type sigma factor [Sphingomonas radiodurans]|uniref:ECF-type sigma factor n=1 Tax=Sphingomonas radiodurans TaxID=2890321 RepID=UPI001E37C219|nr:ECF-type sigma factor [Sphingomonas radiodurans]WBH14997.1 ECF-type sigma factor [Sphingomonas radiodurans]
MHARQTSPASIARSPQLFDSRTDRRRKHRHAKVAIAAGVRHVSSDGGGQIIDYAKLAAEWQEGDREAGNELFGALGNELRAISGALLRQERNTSLSIGDLVNEAMIKLLRLNVMELQSRAHILAMTSRLMRQILIDEARKRAATRHHHTSVTLTTHIAEWEMSIDIMTVEMVLKELAEIDPQRAQIVEMRFFGGMSSADVAIVLGISEPTVKRRWAATRAWLRHRLRQP